MKKRPKEHYIYVRPRDHERLGRLAKAEARSLVAQFSVILDEAYRARGLEKRLGHTQ